MLQGLRTVVFRLGDLDRAKNWYAELVGKAPYFDQPFTSAWTWAATSSA